MSPMECMHSYKCCQAHVSTLVHTNQVISQQSRMLHNHISKARPAKRKNPQGICSYLCLATCFSQHFNCLSFFISAVQQKIFVMPNMDDVWLPIMHSAMDPRSNANSVTETNDALTAPEPTESEVSEWRLFCTHSSMDIYWPSDMDTLCRILSTTATTFRWGQTVHALRLCSTSTAQWLA